MQREIKLSGGEISMLKALGFSGAPLHGLLLLDRVGEMETAEFLDTMEGLLSADYVLSSKVNVQKMEDIERSWFRVNPAHAQDLKEAIRPGRRREQEQKRRRRG
ncbi:MAG: hypothetical protein QOH39_2364 [Verrucomicrobiota bacterium]|jgi:hypothetical protein